MAQRILDVLNATQRTVLTFYGVKSPDTRAISDDPLRRPPPQLVNRLVTEEQQYRENLTLDINEVRRLLLDLATDARVYRETGERREGCDREVQDGN